MTKIEALIELLREARKERSSVRAYKTVVKALAALEIPEADRTKALAWLEYVDDSGKPHKWLADKLAKKPA